MKQKVIINIIGCAGTGKSTLSEAIENLLKENDIEVIQNDVDINNGYSNDLSNIADRSYVEINSIHSKRPSLDGKIVKDTDNLHFQRGS